MTILEVFSDKSHFSSREKAKAWRNLLESGAKSEIKSTARSFVVCSLIKEAEKEDGKKEGIISFDK